MVPAPSAALPFAPGALTLAAVSAPTPALVCAPLCCLSFWPFCPAEACACAEAFTLAEAPGACTLWLVFAPADACPDLTEAFAAADPLTVCAATARLSNPVVTTNFQELFMVFSTPYLQEFKGNCEVAWLFQMQSTWKAYTL
jgi:hypothetical protein